ncbi:WRKY transcription factor 71 [Malania oleifera]|uniref:WRKY transcription factor 71 n=1 Tax=Malania oleifera TaxID=397392 RepID=UPI0025ADF584|nr:WRKY transcription factor 71 [Malania oleifera]
MEEEILFRAPPSIPAAADDHHHHQCINIPYLFQSPLMHPSSSSSSSSSLLQHQPQQDQSGDDQIINAGGEVVDWVSLLSATNINYSNINTSHGDQRPPADSPTVSPIAAPGDSNNNNNNNKGELGDDHRQVMNGGGGITTAATAGNKDRSLRSGRAKKGIPPRIAFHTRSDDDVLDDGYKWRKYGQKSVKNSDHPRSYYRCTHHTCNVKKQIQRLSKETSIVVTTYEGIHNHPCEQLMESLSPLLKQIQFLSRF